MCYVNKGPHLMRSMDRGDQYTHVLLSISFNFTAALHTHINTLHTAKRLNKHSSHNLTLPKDSYKTLKNELRPFRTTKKKNSGVILCFFFLFSSLSINLH